MEEFKEVLNNNLDAYELYQILNNKDDYIIFHLNIVKYVLDREGINYKIKRYYGSHVEEIVTIRFNSHLIDLYLLNKNIMMKDCFLQSFKINRETAYEELKEYLLQRIEE